MVGGKVEHQALLAEAIDGLDVGSRIAVRQSQHDHLGAARCLVRGEIYVMRSSAVFRHRLRHGPARQLARTDERELERGVRGDQLDQLRPDVAASADDTDGFHLGHQRSFSVAGRVRQCATQLPISAKLANPYQNTFHCSPLRQPSAASK